MNGDPEPQDGCDQSHRRVCITPAPKCPSRPQYPLSLGHQVVKTTPDHQPGGEWHPCEPVVSPGLAKIQFLELSSSVPAWGGVSWHWGTPRSKCSKQDFWAFVRFRGSVHETLSGCWGRQDGTIGTGYLQGVVVRAGNH